MTNPPGSGTNSGLARAQQFSKPSTATAVGARPPQQVAQHLPASTNTAPRFGNAQANTQAPRFGNSTPTTLGQHAPVASAQQYRGVSPTPHPVPYSAPSSRSAYSGPSSAPAQHYSAPAQNYSAPAQHYSAPAQHYSAPAQHYSAPSNGGFHSSTPSYHSSAPTFHQSPPSYSAPHVSSGGGGFRGGGGSRGGRR